VWGKYFSHFDATGTIATYFDRWAVQPSSKYYDVIAQGRHGGLADQQIKDGIAQRWLQAGADASAAGTRSSNEYWPPSLSSSLQSNFIFADQPAGSVPRHKNV
jgi:hypothetical protein